MYQNKIGLWLASGVIPGGLSLWTLLQVSVVFKTPDKLLKVMRPRNETLLFVN